MLSDDELRAMRSDARHSPEAEHTVWWMLLARAVERAAYERAAQECFERPYLEVLHDDYWTACKDCADAIRTLGRT